MRVAFVASTLEVVRYSALTKPFASGVLGTWWTAFRRDGGDPRDPRGRRAPRRVARERKGCQGEWSRLGRWGANSALP